MNFNEFLKYVPSIQQEKLLAEEAHLKMSPAERVLAVDEEDYFYKNPRKAAVMMLI